MTRKNDMKPTELRIGNLVMYNGEVVRVEMITKKKIGYHRHKGETRMNYARLFEVEPIPITEELLTKCGFDEPCDGVYEHNYGGFEVTKEGDEWWVSWRGGCDYWFVIKYLHDLQNAYQLITKGELTLQLCNEK